MTYADDINLLTRRYNEAIDALVDSYEREADQPVGFRNYGGTSSLKRYYSDRYEQLVRKYRAEQRAVLRYHEQADPRWAKGRRWLKMLFVAGLVLLLGWCGSAMPADDTPSASSLMDGETEQTYWNAETVPIPYLQDATQYVSNPDGVLSQAAVDRMNTTLRRMEDSLQVQTVVICVNHIENDDPFRLAQDVGNRYGVGHGDRGLVVVLGYQDHSINISPGRALEGDLTDVECRRLQQQYVVPAMRAEMPDSGMIYLVDALSATLQQKQLPQMTTLVSAADAAEEEMVRTVGRVMLVFIGWCLFFLSLNRRYQWLPLVGGVTLTGNPFVEHRSTGVFIGGGGGGFGGGGSFGGGGGSFGGGSFGGGGATSRW